MSTPRINPNDPKWTAYVLGELDPAETEAVERLLVSSPDARALVDELRTTSAALEEFLDAEPSDLLTPQQRAAVRRAADTRPARWSAWMRTPHAWGVAAAAAAIIAIAVALPRWPFARPEAVFSSGSAAIQRSTPSSPTALGPRVAQPAAPAAGSLAQPPAQDQRPSGGVSAPPIAVDRSAAASGAPTGVTLTGVVRDTSGSVLPGVTITATNAVTGAASTAMTDAAGRYTVPNVQSGPNYEVKATIPGFQSASAELPTEQVAVVQRDFNLAVGALAETVTVTGETPVVTAQSSTRAEVSLAPPSATARTIAPPARGSGTGAGRGGGAAAGVAGGVVGGVVGNLSDSFSRSGSLPPNTESYARVGENGFVRASQEPLATFSIDVDTASFSNVRRFLNQNRLPPKDAVRVEELINYFTYDYAPPSGARPIAASMAVTAAPWNSRTRLVRIGIKAREIDAGRRPASNLVFLIDVSGSMGTPEKLPLVKSGLKLLVDQLGENDTVSMVVYASATGLVLPPTHGDRKDVIARAIDDLEAGGSTNGSGGIQLAYRQATANFIRGGVNRVILMTDGDFNVGITDQSELTRLIEDRARSGVFLSVLGFGMGNLKDSTMEKLADTGNGHYAYVDTLNEARKVLVEQMSGTLVTVAKDVKIQVDFNPAKVEAYRLIGYENRVLRPEDFNNDLKDAGEMGAGHTVTALFEIVPRGGTVPGPSVDPSVFQPTTRTAPPSPSTSNDLLVLRMRYKLPDASESTRMDVPLSDREVAFARADADFRFATAVAAFGMILKDSPYRGDATLEWVLDAATGSRGQDRGGYRDEFVSLVRKAMALTRGERRGAILN